MPTYDYLCTTCGKQFEVVQSMKDDALTTCLESVCESEQRGKGAVERQISGGGGVIYKGEGFYLTDYVRKGGTEKSTATQAASPDTASTSSGDSGATSTPASSPAASTTSTATPSSSTSSSSTTKPTSTT